jgi:hypothetical protein
MSFGRLLRNNGLSLCMFGLFLVFVVGLSITGFLQHNQTLQSHALPTSSYADYISSGEFVEAVFENWESEFLQMATLVIATIFLRQRGSADSKKIRGHDDVDTTSRYSLIGTTSWTGRTRALRGLLYANSLGLALIGLFFLSFALHVVGGASAYNHENLIHGEPSISMWQYMASSQFWFESFQNWQSEFLAVGTLLVFSVYLRQRGSPESKPVGAPDEKTGK